MYSTSYNKAEIKKAVCSVCKGTGFLFKGGSITCTNCGEVYKKASLKSKYNAVKTPFKNKIFDSKFEASVAGDLELRKRAGDILDYDTQYRVDCQAFDADGNLAFTEKHKVDFRIHHKDGSFELHEAKGVETDSYKFKRKCLEKLWLPMHKDHIYSVIYQKQHRRKR